MNKKRMIHVRLEEDTSKKLKHLCVDKDISIQEFISSLVRGYLENKKM